MRDGVKITILDENEVLRRTDELAALLADVVAHGASVGFTAPLVPAEAHHYWRKAAGEAAAGHKIIFAALDRTGRIIGLAQLALEPRSNGRHRAEVQKVMVRHDARGRGTGAALMKRLEKEARTQGRTLLFLDTSVGSGGAVEFYVRLGYTLAGGIPDFAANPDGTLAANAIFYKRLS